jgi:hypothetical protein
MRARTLLLALLLGACAQHNRAAKREEFEPPIPVVVHPDIDQRVRYVRHTQERLPDGRLAIRVVLSSHSGEDLALIAETDWLKGDNAPVERSVSRSLLIPSGGTVVYEDDSYSPDVERFTVSVRPASTKRKR